MVGRLRDESGQGMMLVVVWGLGSCQPPASKLMAVFPRNLGGGEGGEGRDRR